MLLNFELILLPLIAWASSPQPPIPVDNPQSPAKVLLGRYLFYDKRVSVNGKMACASCHRQELAFTDGRVRAVGTTGEVHPRNAMTIVNAGFNTAFNRGNVRIRSLEEHARITLLSTQPLELGFPDVQSRFLALLRQDPIYRPLFPYAFPERDPYTLINVTKAIAAFERTVVSADSPYDRFHRGGDAEAISEAAKRGEILFFLDSGPACFRCHAGFSFSDAAVPGRPPVFHNMALFHLPGASAYPEPNIGIAAQTGRAADVGKFKTPTLRNIAVTAPYMHDGSIATLEEVLDHYAMGGRAHSNPGRDRLLNGFPMTPQNRSDLVAFLRSLTDEALLTNPAFADPW